MRPPARVHRPRRPRLAGRGALRSRPWHAVLIALALLLLQGPSVFHLLVVPHVTCVHGELVEASGHPRASRDTDASPQASDQAARIDRGDADGPRHEHCDALAVRVPDVGVFVAPAALLPVTRIDVGDEGREARPVPLLSLAPKSSPPV